MTPSKTSVSIHLEHSNSLELVVALLSSYKNNDYFAYERGEVWHLGIGSCASLMVDAKGNDAVWEIKGQRESRPLHGPITEVARKFVSEYSDLGGRIFGQVGFNYASHIRGQPYTPGKWPLLTLIVPQLEVTLHKDTITVSGYEDENNKEMNRICDILRTIKDSAQHDPVHPYNIDTHHNADEYMAQVSDILNGISEGKYLKVIPSRIVDLEEKVDMLATLLRGRRSNTPARTFSISHAGFKATGFSPELVMACKDGKVLTEPLAGTRSRKGTGIEDEKLRNELLNDSKEIVEHVISVRAAIEELKQVCLPDTVVVEDFMSIRVRGSVQHLGSRVAGSIAPDKDSWDAFNVIFPSITASGIPKMKALEAIQAVESRPRELYAGAILLMDGGQDLEATLALRTVFEDENRQWLQAGAGVVAQSTPEFEFKETCHKLASIAPYVVADVKTTSN